MLLLEFPLDGAGSGKVLCLTGFCRSLKAILSGGATVTDTLWLDGKPDVDTGECKGVEPRAGLFEFADSSEALYCPLSFLNDGAASEGRRGVSCDCALDGFGVIWFCPSYPGEEGGLRRMRKGPFIGFQKKRTMFSRWKFRASRSRDLEDPLPPCAFSRSAFFCVCLRILIMRSLWHFIQYIPWLVFAKTSSSIRFLQTLHLKQWA